jgi:hypothetical protein
MPPWTGLDWTRQYFTSITGQESHGYARRVLQWVCTLRAAASATWQQFVSVAQCRCNLAIPMPITGWRRSLCQAVDTSTMLLPNALLRTGGCAPASVLAQEVVQAFATGEWPRLTHCLARHCTLAILRLKIPRASGSCAGCAA